jgi:hypothetical protein
MDIEENHQSPGIKKQIILSASIFVFLILLTTLIVLYGKGYRIDIQKGQPQISKTGILHVTSDPTGAQVLIDDHLTTATNNSINLSPGKYNIKITKDGYSQWQKDIEIKKEVVSNADATLFPKAPTLQSISTFGVHSVVIDPTGTKLAFKISSQSAIQRNGIYVFDMTSKSFPVLAGQSSSTQIVSDPTDIFLDAQLSWSPDGKQVLATINQNTENPTYYLLNADSMNETPQDITAIYSNQIDTWKSQRLDKEKARIKSLKPAIQKFANTYFRILSWSPDETRILYQASESATMPVFLKTRRIGNNLLYEQRTLEKNSIYVYDRNEDINTRIVENMEEFCTITDTNCRTPFTWLPDSTHIMYVHDKKIDIGEYDGSNRITVYAGPFLGNYVFPWVDGTKLVILTNLNNPEVSPTLYTVGLR